MNNKSFAVGGAVAAAIAASLCCIGPVLFALLGLGAFGAASLFEAGRPYLLTVASLLLALGFYWAYFRKQPSCAPGESCVAKPNPVGRAGAWIALVTVMALALAPYYIGHVASTVSRRSGGVTSTPATPQVVPAESQAVQNATETVTITVEGMSCTTCEVPVRDSLAQTPGVSGAEVSYERGEARVKYDPNKTTVEQIKRAIDSTGYKAR